MSKSDTKSKILKDEKKAPNKIDPSILSVPSRHIVCGKANSGKTTAILDFLMVKDSPYTYPDGRTMFIISLASVNQPKIQNAVNMLSAKKKNKKAWDSLVVYGCKSLDCEVEDVVDKFVKENFEEGINSCIIFDDQYSSRLDSDLITKLYIKGRHRFVSVIFLTQVAFASKFMKDLARQTEYIWIFRNTMEDVQEILKRAVSKDEIPTLLALYKKVIKEDPFGFIVLAPFERVNRIRVNDFFNPIHEFDDT